MSRIAPLPVLVLAAVGCARTASPPHAERDPLPAEVVVAWNDRILALAEAEDHFLTMKGVRTAALMHLAVHDALNTLEPRYERYRLAGPSVGEDGEWSIDPVAVASEAAYAVVVSQYPDSRGELVAERARWAAGVEAGADGRSGGASRVLGQRSAAAVLESRAGDGWDATAEYEWRPPAPGIYADFSEHSGTPEGFVFGVGWGMARPFVMDSASQLRSPPPPAIGSPAYARAFNEVKAVGRRESEVRTSDQARLAMWWKEFVEKSHNRLARELVMTEGLGLWEAARLFALLNMAIFDGYVASFESKYHYNHWRPYTAIRGAGSDGNPATAADPEWTNLHDHTYAFPSYPSAHGSVCGAAMTVLAGFFGDDRPFRMTIREVDSAGPLSPMVRTEPATRAFDSFSEAAEECALSRVYLGIHFRYDSEAGIAMGRAVGRLALDLLPSR